VYRTAAEMDLRDPGHRLDSDGVKLFCSTMGKNVADRAIQVLGGYGYMAEYKVERLFRDAKLLEIGGGTVEAHQKNITRDLTRLERLP
jgi:isovaleryl-CoA dehydrogenase